MSEKMKLKAAAGLMFCGIFLSFADISSDSLHEDPPLSHVAVLDPQSEKLLDRQVKFMLAASRLGNPSLQEKDYRELWEVLDQTPDSVFLAGLLVNEYKKAKDKDPFVNQMKRIALRHPGAFSLSAITADLLRLQNRKDESLALLRQSAEYMLSRQEEMKKLPENSEQYARYLIRILMLHWAEQGKYPESDLLLTRFRYRNIFFDDLVLLQFLLQARYFLMLQTPPDKKKAFHWESPREKAEKQFNEAAGLYLSAIRSEHRKNRMIRLGMHRPGMFFLMRSQYGSGAEQVIFSELMSGASSRMDYAILTDYFAVRKDPANSARAWNLLMGSPGLPPGPVPFRIQSAKLQLAGDMPGALRAMELAWIAAPGDSLTAFSLARLYIRQKKYASALEVLKSLRPAYAAYLIAGVCYNEQDQHEKALAEFLLADAAVKKVVHGVKKKGFTSSGEEIRRFAERKLLIAFSADKAGKYEIMEKHLRELLAEEPDHAQALNFLGYSFADRNIHLHEAEGLIRKALQKDPSSAAYMDSLAWVLYRLGRFPEAEEWILKAVAAQKDDVDAVISDHAGDISAALGKRRKALEYWKKAACTYSGDGDADPVKITAKIRKAEKGPEK